jgi:two-component system, NarL family, sensor histidine kinase DesK
MSTSFDEACDRPGTGPGGPPPRTLLNRTLPFNRAPRAVRAGAGLVWSAFIVFPLIDAIDKHGSVLQHVLIIAGAALFIAAYVTMVVTWRLQRPTPVTFALFALMVSLACALTIAQSQSWAFLFIYCAACTALVARKQLGFYAVILCTVLAGVTSALGGASGGNAISYVASAAGIGLLMLVMSDLRLRNQELNEARAELARLAVTRERQRFARDLHDLLGHSLSVITLKAELAGRMLHDRPPDAAREIAELEQVARTALSEVREAVSGYHQPTLEGELAGARMALSAAGIEADVQEAHVPLDPGVEAVLAWAIREGATNVIRHSGARHCTLRVTASLTDAGVEVIDDGAYAEARPAAASNGSSNGYARGGSDGHGAAGAASEGRGAGGGASEAHGSGGHGLAGLAERARLVGGTLEAGRLGPGGYRLGVTVPVTHT